LKKSRLLESGSLERFSVYGFSIDYPPVCRIEFNPKSRREKGDVVLHFPDKEKLFVSWGDLEGVQKKFPTAKAHADHSIGAMTKTRNVANVERIADTSLMIKSHEAAFNQARFDELSIRLGFGRTVSSKHLACSLHIHCPISARYFVVYAILSPNAPDDFDQLFLRMAKSFTCH
jgi:hypothetical protein